MEGQVPESTIALESYSTKDQPNNIKEILIPINDLLKGQIEMAQSLFTNLNENDANASYISELKDSLESLQQHISFTLDVLGSDHTLQILQENSLSPEYLKLKTKEDINSVMLSYILDFIRDDLLPKIQDELDKLSKNIKNKQDASQISNMNDVFDWIQILVFRLNLVNESYPYSVTYPSTDLFSLPKTSQVWQELEKLLIVKKLTTLEDVQKELNPLYSMLKSLYALIKAKTEGIENPEFPSTFSFIKESLKYRKNPAKTEALSLLYLRNPNYRAFRAMKIAEDPWIQKLTALRHQHVGYDKYIYVPRTFPVITKELLLKEYNENILNKIHPNPIQEDNHSQSQSSPANIFTQSEDTIGVRILAPEPLNLQDNFQEKMNSVFHQARKLILKRHNQPEHNFDAIVIHIHGGGYVTGSSGMHRVFLNQWVNNLKMVHFSIDYRLAPENKYPAALDDVWQAYLWIINNATSLLRIKYQKVILTGDSAGGNLATALTYRLIQTGMRSPDGCLLLYPSLLRITNLCSPSNLYSLDDPLLPFKIHRLFGQAYTPEEYEPKDEDPLLRPLMASDELLSQLPPVRIVVGSRDLLYDNCLRFVDKLRKLNKEVKMVVYENLAHGFYNMSALKCFKQINDESCDLVRELIHL